MEKDVKEFSTATEKLIQVDIEKEMRESFLQYSMAVLVSRALPDVRDGMKPVHRRIIYTMNEADNTSSKPYRKCEPSVITRQRVAAVTLPLIRPSGKAFSLKKLYHTNRVRYNLQY